MMMLNLFIAAIIQAMEQANQRIEVKITDDDITAFRKVWKKYDSRDSGKIFAADLITLLNDLPEELRVLPKGEKNENKIFKIFRKAKIPITSVKISYDAKPQLKLQ